MQWHFLFWRKSNLDDCGALTAAVSGCGIKLVKGEAFKSREGFRNRKSNTQKNPTHEEGQINSSHFRILSLLWNAPCLVGFCVQRWCEHPRAFAAVLQQGWSTLGLFNHVPGTDPGQEAQGTGANVSLHAISSSAAWTPASDKSICPFSVSLHDNFAFLSTA